MPKLDNDKYENAVSQWFDLLKDIPFDQLGEFLKTYPEEADYIDEDSYIQTTTTSKEIPNK